MNSLTAERPVTRGADPAVRVRSYTKEQAPGVALNVELLAWLVVIAGAAALRLLDLSAVPLGPFDGPRARAALVFSRGAVSADWGGDLTSGLAVLAFKLFGESESTARLASALCGVLSVAVLALYRPWIGRAPALVAALLLAISPVAIAAARSLSPEAAALPLALALPPLAGRVLLGGRLRSAPLLLLVLGFGLGSGAIMSAVALVTVAWLAVESIWLDDPNPGAALRELARRPGLLLICLIALLPGLLLALDRYGTGGERISLAAISAWSGPAGAVSMPEAWWYVPVVLAIYEPLALALGLTGAVLVSLRWRGAGAGLRLALIWTVAGGALTVLWLHRDPAQLLLLTVPLALLGGYLTACGAGAVVSSLGGRGWLALVPLVAALGYCVLMLARWANAGVVFTDELISVFVVLIGMVVAVVGAITLLHRPVPGFLLLLACVLLAPATLHAATSVAIRGGPELLAGVRSLPEAEAVARRLDEGAAPQVPVQVERRLWPFLAWPLRAREASLFVQSPPFVPAVLVAPPTASGDPRDPRNGIPVGEYWLPDAPDLSGWVAWWLLRTPWSTPQQVRAELQFR